MNMSNLQDPLAFNEAFLAQATSHDPGMVKQAGVSIESYIRDFVRENSFLPHILTEQPITPQDLDIQLDLDELTKIVEKEPESEAYSISFRGLPQQRYLENSAAKVNFEIFTTDETIKNIYELRTRRNDLRKIVQDNHAKDIDIRQDTAWMNSVEQIIAQTGQEENLPGGFTSNNFADFTKVLERKKIPIGCMLINSETAKDILKWDDREIGDANVAAIFNKGLYMTEIYGIKLIITNKREIVPTNKGYIFGQEDFLGKFYTMDNTKVYFEQKGFYIRFFAYKVSGATIINTNSVWKANFD